MSDVPWLASPANLRARVRRLTAERDAAVQRAEAAEGILGESERCRFEENEALTIRAERAESDATRLREALADEDEGAIMVALHAILHPFRSEGGLYPEDPSGCDKLWCNNVVRTMAAAALAPTKQVVENEMIETLDGLVPIDTPLADWWHDAGGEAY